MNSSSNRSSEGPGGSPPLLRLQGIHKSFGGIQALRGVDFDLRSGEIHALLGENGAGKSTLIKILAGIHAPDSGVVELDGSPVNLGDVSRSEACGIRVIHQELSLAPNLSVAENMFLGREPTRWGWIQRDRMVQDAERVRDELGFPELGHVHARVGELSVARQQMLEIARALSTKARILILDEPTASLSRAETESLFGKLERLRREGVAILYISHRLEEIRRLADRVTVLRDGQSVGTQVTAGGDPAEWIRWMVGRELKDHYPRPPHRPGTVALRVHQLRGPSVNGVSFELRHGEILGFAGLVGAGRTELARLLFGIDRASSGRIEVEGQPVVLRSPSDALAAGLALVPEDRKRQGLILSNTVGYNLALPWTRDWMKPGFPNLARRSEIVQRAINAFGIKTASERQPVGSLSGGNQQKVVVGRWMEHPPRILILDEPTRGVDVGAREEMFQMLHHLMEQGMAVILISSDLPEVMNLSHRLALYRDGTILREVDPRTTSAEEIMADLTAPSQTLVTTRST